MKLKLRFNRKFQWGSKREIWESGGNVYNRRHTHTSRQVSNFFPNEHFFLPLTLAIFSILKWNYIRLFFFFFWHERDFSSVDFILLLTTHTHDTIVLIHKVHDTEKNCALFLILIYLGLYKSPSSENSG